MTFEVCCSFYFLCRAKLRRKPKGGEKQYDEDDPEAYKDMEIPDKVGVNGHGATRVLLSVFTVMECMSFAFAACINCCAY